MEFTYNAYRQLINLLKENGYAFKKYTNYNEIGQTVIMRHDIDLDPEYALAFAEIEAEEGICSTYFPLMSSNCYNIYSKRTADIIKEINRLGHDIGLHFDEVRHKDIETVDELKRIIKCEARIMAEMTGCEIKSVAMHRPSKAMLSMDLRIDGLINSYSKEFFSDMKYLSDSRMHWREDVIGIIKSRKYARLHVLTHAASYRNENGNLESRMSDFISLQKNKAVSYIMNNITNPEEVLGGIKI